MWEGRAEERGLGHDRVGPRGRLSEPAVACWRTLHPLHALTLFLSFLDQVRESARASAPWRSPSHQKMRTPPCVLRTVRRAVVAPGHPDPVFHEVSRALAGLLCRQVLALGLGGFLVDGFMQVSRPVSSGPTSLGANLVRSAAARTVSGYCCDLAEDRYTSSYVCACGSCPPRRRWR